MASNSRSSKAARPGVPVKRSQQKKTVEQGAENEEAPLRSERPGSAQDEKADDEANNTKEKKEKKEKKEAATS